jgi:Cro/C1-type helix-turn-helix DNA-binding protein
VTTDLQERVTLNVKVLMAIQGIGDQKTLAARLGWGADRVSTSLSGRRRWALSDLQELADVFGVTPGDMLSDATSLVGAVNPVAIGTTDPRRRTTPRYFGQRFGTVVPFPLVSAS